MTCDLCGGPHLEAAPVEPVHRILSHGVRVIGYRHTHLADCISFLRFRIDTLEKGGV